MDLREKKKIIYEETGNICKNFNKLYSCLHCFDPDYIDGKIKKYHKEGFFMMNLFCLFMKYLEANPKYIMDKLEEIYDKELIFTKYDKKVKIYSMNYKKLNIDKIFLIKFWVNDIVSIDEFYNESLVSITAINKVRKKLLNFSTIYGIIEDFEYENKKYLVSFYEYIDGKPLSKFIRSSSEKDLDCIILQVIYALAYVHKNYGFVHNDLHGENILIKELDKEYNIPYYDKDDKLFYIKSKYLPIIIDFELSCVKYKKNIISLQDDRRGELIINGSCDMYDTILFIVYTLFYIKNNENLRSKMYEKYMDILKKFTNNSISLKFNDIRTEIVKKYNNNNNSQWINVSTYEFIDFLKEEFIFRETNYNVKDNIKNVENVAKGIEEYLEIPKNKKFNDILNEFADKIGDKDIKEYIR